MHRSNSPIISTLPSLSSLLTTSNLQSSPTLVELSKMRFSTLTANVLAGLALASALPQGNPGTSIDPNTCCCCDSSQPAIVCTHSTQVFSCACLAVQCPADAPVIHRNLDEEPLPTPPSDPLVDPTPPSGEIDCCCCNIGGPEISCTKKTVEEGCICPLVLCPPDAPTVWPESPAPPPTPAPQPEVKPAVKPAPEAIRHAEEEEDREMDCCCCDISRSSIVCDSRPESVGCFCALVACPPGAPTIREKFPEPTGV